MEKLEETVKNFREAIKDAKENPLVIHLEDYERRIAGNALAGNLGNAIIHANLLMGFYLNSNPYKPEEDKQIDALKEKDPMAYMVMDAGRKMYKVGKAAEKFLELI